jgi:hypothetical protein
MSKKSIAAARPLKLALLASFALGAIGAGSNALAVTNNATATATATVVTPVLVTSSANLSFGKFSAGTGGTVTVDTAGARTNSGALLAGGTATAAKFDITGDNSAAYNIDSVTGTSTTLSNGSGGTMALALVGDFTGAGGAGSAIPGSGTLSGTGTQSLFVGGTLTVGAAQAPGSYTGTIAITVAYP